MWRAGLYRHYLHAVCYKSVTQLECGLFGASIAPLITFLLENERYKLKNMHFYLKVEKGANKTEGAWEETAH